MASYVVMEPPGRSADAPADAKLVRDGFSLIAFLVPPLWLIWHRLWIEAALAFAAALILTALGEVAGFGLAGSLLSLLVSLYVGLEGPALRLAAYRRRGWREWGVVDADTASDAEMRYLGEADLSQHEAEPLAVPTPQAVRPKPAAPALGLLHYPGRA
ncbi:DUF2628 domain-containing protein [Pseudaminobacter arsenicus]|uniref:DUF2628 domain-containing protein n=1 Tax=Borborobacter arsenicus TaxID=1851146 RepID=A0A432V904_9HYPH|nr:DUF2628 domain-containing protein [Pseudaminobacter arsenicus]RUM98573.1 DUF2628 domain-containing protein [Pseudaminobacter arsenicus]